ncbi:UPF0182 family protein [Serpentinicella sp. ANB-PHB4]|uniref:UPF0182 family membrane protein n=1 Tax=Serpentinicella sp. ANB-PHB4 TaxID=3074076 RepID=UPI002857AECB|nr:UPF0182 family protein [Serpentinicella sp. ANB-PHB4]MDR5659102.1 UPF0182 family protein [Serpentinicella sp. ANB-PHB4]
MNRKGIFVTGVILVLLFLITSFTEIITFITDFQWFQEVGYEQVFLLELKTQLKIGIPLFIVSMIFYYIYLYFLKKNYYKRVQAYHTDMSEKTVNKLIAIPAVLLAALTSRTIAGSLWFDILTYINAKSFDIADPIFNKDISFYMFELPLFEKLINVMTGIIFAVVFVTILFYIALFIIRRPTLYEAKTESLDYNQPFVKDFLQVSFKQITILAALFFVIIAVRNYFAAYSILYSTRGAVFGASYTDVSVSLYVYRIKMIVSLLAVVMVGVAYIKRNLKMAIAAPVALVIITVMGGITAGLVQNFVVDPNVIQRETPYIENHIKFTQQAYGLDDIKVRDFDVLDNLTLDDLENNQETIRNIRINDYRPTLESYNQLNAIRLYYRFLDVDIDRYMVNGEYKQVFLAPRELDITRLSENASTWMNHHLKYTHGYGVVMSPVNQVTAQGQPEMIIRNIPPISTTDIEVTRPEIYFGELTDHYIIVNTEEKEFDYPMGENNAETLYEGEAGISLRGINRVLYALRERQPRILLSGSITSDSRIVMNRNAHERVNKIAPFIEYDEDPYIVINEGRLYWIIDGYTVAGRYPYAQPYLKGDRNYIRNSVKVVIDAYNGDVNYYISDETDPVILTYNEIFPGLFQHIDEMKEGLRSHIRYPQDLFDIQSEVYELYHMNNPVVFYTQEDLWRIPQEKYFGNQQPVESQYMIFKLPEKEEEEFILSVPYTPNRLNNMTALLVARNDGDQYGELILYRLPKDRNIYGPMQIESRIDQDPEISSQLTLWGEGGSTVIRGNLLVIPIEDSILYVEPLYIKAANTESPPEMRRVIVAYQDEIVMEESLDKALEQIFGGTGRKEGPREDIEIIIDDGLLGDINDLVQKANDAFDNANKAVRDGDWAAYGRYINELEDILSQLQKESEKEILE